MACSSSLVQGCAKEALGKKLNYVLGEERRERERGEKEGQQNEDQSDHHIPEDAH